MIKTDMLHSYFISSSSSKSVESNSLLKSFIVLPPLCNYVIFYHKESYFGNKNFYSPQNKTTE